MGNLDQWVSLANIDTKHSDFAVNHLSANFSNNPGIFKNVWILFSKI